MGGVRVVRYRIYACIPKIYNLKLDSFVSVHGWYAFLSCALDFSFCNEYTENATVDPSNRRRADYCSVQLQSWLLLLGCRRGWDLLQTVHQIFQFMNTVDTPGQNGLLLGLCLDSSFDFLHFFLVFWKTPRTNLGGTVRRRWRFRGRWIWRDASACCHDRKEADKEDGLHAW